MGTDGHTVLAVQTNTATTTTLTHTYIHKDKHIHTELLTTGVSEDRRCQEVNIIPYPSPRFHGDWIQRAVEVSKVVRRKP